MRLKDFFEIPTGIRFMFNNLNTGSSIAKRYFASEEFVKSPENLKNIYNKLFLINEFVKASKTNSVLIDELRLLLSDLKEIFPTLERLIGGATLDDIELFEIKSFAILSEQIQTKVSHLPDGIILINPLEEVIKILDPDNLKSASFYIYDSYSTELTYLRGEFKNDPKNLELFDKTLEIEDRIRTTLSSKLFDFVKFIRFNYFSILNLDILIAKSVQIRELNLCIPEFSDSENLYEGIFNPEIDYYLKQSGKDFKKVDFISGKNLTLITGANMGGKTVFLKTLALIHLLFHFGMGIPALKAKLSPVDDVFLLTGDDQNAKMGYSSFSGEVLRINSLLKKVKEGEKILALIDEPARSTNPSEGSALVGALINRLELFNTFSVVTTHYNIINSTCKRMRVKGLIDGVMDYTLIEDENNEAPTEAINIARSLGADSQWIDEAEKLFNDTKI